MFRRGKAKEPEPVTQEELDSLYKQVKDEHPDLDFNAISAEVSKIIGDRPLALPDEAPSTEAAISTSRPSVKLRRDWPWLIIAMAMLAIGLVGGYLGRPILDAQLETATAETNAETTPVSTEVVMETPPQIESASFSGLDAAEFEPGKAIQAWVKLTDSNDIALEGQTVTLMVDPPEAGTVSLEKPASDEKGEAHFTFTAGSGAGTIIAENEQGEVLARQPFSVAADPLSQLTVKVERTGDRADQNPLTGVPFPLQFYIENTGEADVANVWLHVTPPPGISPDPNSSQNNCDRGENRLSCELAQINAGQAPSNTQLHFIAQSPGDYTFDSSTYYLTIGADGGGEGQPPGGDMLPITVEPPMATTLVMIPDLFELPADSGATTMGVNLEVRDQQGELLPGETRVRLSVGSSAEAVATEEQAEVQGIECTVIEPGNLRPNSCLAEESGNDPVRPDLLPIDTQLRALARQTPECIYVEVLDTEGGEGYFFSGDAAESKVTCEGDLTTLSNELPTNTALDQGSFVQGQFVKLSEGFTRVDYASGSEVGPVTLVAAVVNEDDSPGISAEEVITLREGGLFTGGEHLYTSPNFSISDNILLFRPPENTPLELLPADETIPNARQVRMRIWVPGEFLQPNQQGLTTLGFASSAPLRVHFGLGPDDEANSPDLTYQMLQLPADGSQVHRLGCNGDGTLCQIIIEGWVKNVNIR